MCTRFGEKHGTDIVEEFNKLVQKGELEEYNEKLANDAHLTESYFVSSYVSGLKDEIKSLVKLSRPKDLASAYEQAKL